MELYERIKELAANKKISIRQLEETLKFGNGTINRWRTNTPGIDKIQKVADYFGVSVDYLLGRTNDTKMKVENIVTDADLDKILDGVMSFDGKPLTDEDREAVRAFMQGRKSK
ncbi:MULTISPECIES: helix-turn-helix domain-containing protein [Enterococcus]|uniref:helix-turn-helix domain-containing protein n=1 Tax=Enterococcus TaxID=1350 RepID=UPI00189FE08D|nr:helix-turn-helix transcriptional regulator [Enterococcus dispar]